MGPYFIECIEGSENQGPKSRARFGVWGLGFRV